MKPIRLSRKFTTAGVDPFTQFTWVSRTATIGEKFIAKELEFPENWSQNAVNIVAGGLPPAHALAAAENTAGSLTVKVLRTEGSSEPDNGVVRAVDLKGLPLGEARYTFASGERASATAMRMRIPASRVVLPQSRLRNRAIFNACTGEATAWAGLSHGAGYWRQAPSHSHRAYCARRRDFQAALSVSSCRFPPGRPPTCWRG